MESIKLNEKNCAFLESGPWLKSEPINNSITERAIGSIITVVAVLLSHILRNPVEIINPKIILLGVLPVSLIIFKAILLCEPIFSIAVAKMNPPKKRKITGLPYGEEAFLTSEMPKSGKKRMGKRAVTKMGTASVIHQIIMKKDKASVLEAIGETSKGLKINKSPKTMGPRIKPDFLNKFKRKFFKSKEGWEKKMPEVFCSNAFI